MTSETEAKASRYKPSVANTPPLVRGLALLWVMGYFLLTIPFILLTGRFRGQKVHSLTYFSAAALLLAALGVAHNHFHFHKHTYCDVRGFAAFYAKPIAQWTGHGRVGLISGLQTLLTTVSFTKLILTPFSAPRRCTSQDRPTWRRAPTHPRFARPRPGAVPPRVHGGTFPPCRSRAVARLGETPPRRGP